ncbi:hypothetical protein B0H67DRAFT_214094 [Lasiosphaeris hirsuta]|uniref:Secreted protein n=1 Tax=Lasiosphaeris hirsuta TaxID=260670 RepID=A0AA40AEU8_9PEZI|nr:hypothetical protein B0H67DRAFT_214094 [Lasiosphaeris hirsuta]
MLGRSATSSSIMLLPWIIWPACVGHEHQGEQTERPAAALDLGWAQAAKECMATAGHRARYLCQHTMSRSRGWGPAFLAPDHQPRNLKRAWAGKVCVYVLGRLARLSGGSQQPQLGALSDPSCIWSASLLLTMPVRAPSLVETDECRGLYAGQS